MQWTLFLDTCETFYFWGASKSGEILRIYVLRSSWELFSHSGEISVLYSLVCVPIFWILNSCLPFKSRDILCDTVFIHSICSFLSPPWLASNMLLLFLQFLWLRQLQVSIFFEKGKTWMLTFAVSQVDATHPLSGNITSLALASTPTTHPNCRTCPLVWF